MKHPDPECQKKQEQFLKNLPEEIRESHAMLFEIGNATYRYHQLATKQNKRENLKFYYEEWLQGLRTNIAADMRKRGLEDCMTTLSFTRYVNERGADIGLDDWLKENLSEDTYNYYRIISNQTSQI